MQNKNLQTIFVLGTVYSSWWHAEFTFSNYANVRVRICSNYANAFVLKKTISKYCEHTHVRTEGECSQPSHRHVLLAEGSGEHQVRRQMAGHATSGLETPQTGARDAGRVAEPVLVSFKINCLTPIVFVCARVVN